MARSIVVVGVAAALTVVLREPVVLFGVVLQVPVALLGAGLSQTEVEHWFALDLCGERAD